MTLTAITVPNRNRLISLAYNSGLQHADRNDTAEAYFRFEQSDPCWDKPIRLLECGCCGQFHPEHSFLPGGSANYMNDCRYDANRFSSDEDFTTRTGLRCVEVWLDEQEQN